MNIAIFTDSFSPGVGGTEKAVLGLATELAKKNNVLLVCPNYDGSCDDTKFPFRVVRVFNINLFKIDYLSFPECSRKLKKEILAFKPDIIHCQSVSPMAKVGLKFAKKFNIPCCMTIHTKFKECFSKYIKIKPIVNIMLKDIVKKCNRSTKVFTVCNDMAKELHSYGYNGDVKVIRNGAMFDVVNNKIENAKLAIENYSINKKIPTLLFVGHIVEFKNIEFLLNVYKLLNDKNFEFQALFVGYGSDYNKYVQKAKDMHLKNVQFTNVIKDKQLLSSVYSAGDLFLFASFFDNDPLVIVEAATHQTPTLTIKDTGSSERIKDNVNGYLTDFDKEAFANKIINIFKNKEVLDRISKEASYTIPTTWEDTANLYLAEYKKLIEKNKK